MATETERLAALEAQVEALTAELHRNVGGCRAPLYTAPVTEGEAQAAAVDHSEKTVAELKEHAAANDIPLNGATTKADILAAIEDHETAAG